MSFNKSILRAIFPMLALSYIYTHSAFAQDGKSIDSDTTIHQEHKLDNVVVTGSRTPRLLKNEPIPVRVIKAKEIKMLAPQNFIELLQSVLPGVEFSKHGSMDKINVQGFDGSSMLFLVDGELITTGSGNTIDFERINPDDIERIEVLRGAASALYGSNAIGGVVNIITRQANAPFSLTASARIDSRLGQKYDGSVGVKRGIFSSLTGVQYRRDESYTLKDGKGTSIAVAGNKAWTLSEKLTLKPIEELQLSLTGRANFRKQHWTDKIDFLYDSYDVIGSVQWKISEKASSDISYHYNNYLRDTLFTQTPDLERSHIFTEALHHLRGQFNYEWQPQRYLNAGIEYIHDGVSSNRFISPEQGERQFSRNCILYGQGVYRIITPITLSYGGRLDIHSGFGVHYTSRISAMYKPMDCLSVRLSYSEGYRAPTLQERFFFFHHQPFYILGNPNLKPEKSRMFALSLEGKWSNLSTMFNVFHNNMYNRIGMKEKVNAQGTTDYLYENIAGNGQIIGLEAQGQVALPWGLGIRLSAAYTHDRRVVKDEVGNSVNIHNTRPFSALAALTYDKHFSEQYALYASLSGRYLSPFTSAQYDKDDRINAITLPAHFYGRLSVEQRFFKHYSLNLGVDNLFDYKPSRLYVSSPVTPGRVFSATFRIQF